MTARFPIGRRVATGEAMPTAAEMNELLEERDALAAGVAELVARRRGLTEPVLVNLQARVEHAVAQLAGVIGRSAMAARLIEVLFADPILSRYDDGRVEIAWPDDADAACIVARPVADALVDDLNRMRAQLADREQDDVEASESEDA